MRAPILLTMSSGLVLAGVATHSAGCGRDAADCGLALTCPSFASDHPLSGDGAPPPDCDTPPSERTGGVDARCGIFAAPSAEAGGSGTLAKPFASLQAAVDLAAASGKPVYACAGDFAENVRVASGVTVFGALQCDKGWTWDATARTRIKPSPDSGGDEIAARLGAGSGKTRLFDVDVIAPDSVAPGASSIALLVEDTTAELTRCTLTAGDGKDGASGVSPADDPALDGEGGVSGFGICGATSMNPGPLGPTKACAGIASHGGDGGDGSPPLVSVAGPGETGNPTYVYAPTAGKGGAGQSTTSCESGHDGADGLDGTPGSAGDGPGRLSPDGYRGVDGGDGGDGRPGQGGGGGGGARGKSQVACAGQATLDRAGATGGSGGTGGCGGKGGSGGQAGGASIALASLATGVVTLTDVVLKVGVGGKGGDGAAGQNGGNKGAGAPGGGGASGTSSGCHGGDGGQGGPGGPGGGGQGGDVYGIAYTQAPPSGGVKVMYKGITPRPGTGGAQGTGGNPNGRGANGMSGELVKVGGA